MTKTALQQAFSRLEELYPDLFNIYSERGRTFVNEFHQFLGVEKNQIMDSFNEGFTEGCRYTTGFEQTLWADDEQYYNETYKTK